MQSQNSQGNDNATPFLIEPVTLAEDLPEWLDNLRFLIFNKFILTVIDIYKYYGEHKSFLFSNSDGDMSFFDIVRRVLQRVTLASFLFMCCLNYILRMSITQMQEKWFHTEKKPRRRRYPTDTNTDPDYADDLMLLAITPAHTEINTLK